MHFRRAIPGTGAQLRRLSMTDIWTYEPCPPPPCEEPPPPPVCEEPPPPPPCEPPEPERGNNGWGNGIDGTNPGSFAGPESQVSWKLNEAVPDKFLFKFEGR
jgi:hypothetical protein